MNNRLKSRYSQTKTIKEIPIPDKPNHYYKATLFYSKGGLNYFNYKQEERGYYLSVKAVEQKQADGYTLESYVIGNGVKSLVQAANRFSEKTLDALSYKNYDQVIAEFINWILHQNPKLAV